MIFVIEGTEYDVNMGLAKVSLHTLFELKVKHGISAKDLQGMARYLEKFNGAPATDLMDDKVALRAMMVVIWLARRYAGEKLSMEEANSFAMDSFFIKASDEELAQAGGGADPKAVTESDPTGPAQPPSIPTT